MTDWIAQFERDCLAANLKPTAVLQHAGLHKSAWWRWKSGDVSPTLRSFDAACAALVELTRKAA